MVSPSVATVALDAGNVIVVLSVPDRVILLFTVNVLAFASVIVPVLVVRVRLLIVPGSTTLAGSENVHVPVVVTVQVPVTVICPAVPAMVMLVTVPSVPANVLTAFSDATFVSSPGDPTVVTSATGPSAPSGAQTLPVY